MKAASLPIPTEAHEQKLLVQYLRVKNIPHFRVPNETYTKSWKQKAGNKALGVSSGVPDLFVVINGQLVAIEMKRRKGGVLSENQFKWVEILMGANTPVHICKGFEQAKAVIDEYLREVT